jgi:hypothetical protein
MKNRRTDKRNAERRNGGERREIGKPIEKNHRSGKDRRGTDRRTG